MKFGAIYYNSGLPFRVRVLRSFNDAKLPLAICVKWGHLEMDRNSVRTRVKSSGASVCKGFPSKTSVRAAVNFLNGSDGIFLRLL